jgi:hypothetical protein
MGLVDNSRLIASYKCFGSNLILSKRRQEIRFDILIRLLRATQLRITTRKIRANNNRPDAVADDFRWVADQDNQCNILVFIDTHADTSTGNLVASGGANNSVSITPWEVLLYLELLIHMLILGRLKMLENYVGDHFRRASQAIRSLNASRGDKPFMRGLVLCSCGPTGRVTNSVTLLKKMVE